MSELNNIPQEDGNLREAPKKNPILKYSPLIVVAVAVILAGAVSGIVVSSQLKSKSPNTESKKTINTENLTGQQKESFNQTFKDQAEGKIEKNDKLDKYAQGTHILIRPGGEDQTAFLTSSVLDLGEFIGKRVIVYGETFGSSQVGWLMDVGKVEEVN